MISSGSFAVDSVYNNTQHCRNPHVTRMKPMSWDWCNAITSRTRRALKAPSSRRLGVSLLPKCASSISSLKACAKWLQFNCDDLKVFARKLLYFIPSWLHVSKKYIQPNPSLFSFFPPCVRCTLIFPSTLIHNLCHWLTDVYIASFPALF